MAEQTIVGVDFSGAQGKDPWITTAILQDQFMSLKCCEAIPREDLKKRLLKLPSDAIAAMDFPFGVPHRFAMELGHTLSTMPELWKVAADKEYRSFVALREGFTKQGLHQEFLRCGDVYFDGPMSPLNIRMLPMTFRGMEMLHYLWKGGCRVPPLPKKRHNGPTLLETMPGVWLRYFRLPYKLFKGSSQRHRANRKKILDGLKNTPSLEVRFSDKAQESCLSYHDALDSAVAAIAAALWVRKPDIFLRPRSNRTIADLKADGEISSKGRNRISPGIDSMTELKAARLEGWIYAPKKN